MMSAVERNFADFHLGDNVYELADRLIPEIAEGLEVPLGPQPNSEDLQAVVAKVGQNKVLRENAEITAFDRDQMVGFVERSGVQQGMNRSLWTPDIKGTIENIDLILGMGGVANWTDRLGYLVQNAQRPVHVLAGSRVMDTPTERSNHNISGAHDNLGRYPTESEYIRLFTAPHLGRYGVRSVLHSYDTKDGDELLRNMFADNPDLLHKNVAVARVANAGVLMATQVRAVARTMNPEFDADPSKPQLYVLTDEFPLARTEDQEGLPQYYQKAATALRQVALTAKKLHETGEQQ